MSSELDIEAVGEGPRPPWMFALVGAWIGVLVVLLAWALAVELSDRGWTWSSLGIAHAENPLFWFVDLTPLYLGWIGWLLGLNEGLAARAHTFEQRLLDVPTIETIPPLPGRTSEAPTGDIDTSRDGVTTLDREPGSTATVARFAHELRTPLNAVIGYGELLRDDLEEDGRTERAADADRVVHAGRHLLALVDDVLDLARLEARRLSVHLENLGPRTLVDEVLGTIGPTADANKNRLVRDVPDDLPEVRGDALRVRQVLLNLLSNACKFTESGTVTLTVRPSDPGFLAFDVSDTGLGLEPEQIARLFREFSQPHADPQRYGGTGLGLAISKRLADLMGGRIDVESEPGLGSTFTLVLPVTHGARAPRIGTALTLEQQAFAVPKGLEASSLVVHPDAALRDLLRRALTAAGFRAEMAATGAEALEKARGGSLNLAVLGHDLPDLSGLEVLRSLKERRGGASLPVVYLAPPESRQEAWDAGAAEILSPPLDLRMLERIARRYRRAEGTQQVLLVQTVGARRDSLVQALRRDGLDVEAVDDGLGAVATWRGDPPDVVVLELGPEGDDRILEKLAAEPRWRTVPALAYASRTLVGWSLPGLADRVDRVVVCGSDRWEDVVEAVRDGVGDMLSRARGSGG